MQRVATELYDALLENKKVTVEPMVLRSTWERTHINTPFFILRSIRDIKRLLKQDAVDVILFSSMVTASIAVLINKSIKQAGIKTAAIVHGQDVTTPFGPYQKFVPKVFNALDAVLPVSRATGEQCTMRGLPKEKLHVLPNGVKLDRFAPLAPFATMRNELFDAFDMPHDQLPTNALLLCSVGRQVKRKGFDWFIDNVMPRLPANVHYWLAGDGPEGPAIQALAEQHNLSDRVQLLGRVSDEQLACLYRGADLFMMPNVPVHGTMEGFGVVMLEAGMGGLPVIASRLEGIQDVITEGQNGHYVESGDTDGFIKAIMAYHNKPDAIVAASKRAFDHTANTFGWETVAGQYVDVLAAL